MIQELLYTSYQGEGLRKGSGGGFCTVLSTEGMAPNVAKMLEDLSGYKHPFDQHDPRSAKNPVNYRHIVRRLGGETLHVLSRIADVRSEHTGRTNKLAHHVALTGDSLALGGPSWTLASDGFCRDSWDGNVALVPERRSSILPSDDIPISVCQGWHRLAGDAGWAGTVAENLLDKNAQPTSIIFPIGADVLNLVNEVFSLLPHAARWNTTFSTYFTLSSASTSCALRFILDGTDDAIKIRRDHRANVIDLTTSLGDPKDSSLVEAARTGRLQHPMATAREPSAGTQRRRAASTASTRRRATRKTKSDEPVELDSVSMAPPTRRASQRTRSNTAAPTTEPHRRDRDLMFKVAIGTSLALLLLMLVFLTGLGAFLGGLTAQRNANADARDAASGDTANAQPQPVSGDPAAGKPASSDPAAIDPASNPPSSNPPASGAPATVEPRSDSQDDRDLTKPPVAPNQKDPNAKDPGDTKPPAPADTKPGNANIPSTDQGDPNGGGPKPSAMPLAGDGENGASATGSTPNADGKDRKPKPPKDDKAKRLQSRILSLPELKGQDATAFFTTEDDMSWNGVQLYENIGEQQDLELSLFGSELFGGDTYFDMDRDWQITVYGNTGEFVVGRFYLEDQSLMFRWDRQMNPGLKDIAGAVRWCKLQIQRGDDLAVCRLSRPLSIKRSELKTGTTIAELLGTIAPNSGLRLELKCKKQLGRDFRVSILNTDSIPAITGKTATVFYQPSIPGGGNRRAKIADVTVGLTKDQKLVHEPRYWITRGGNPVPTDDRDQVDKWLILTEKELEKELTATVVEDGKPMPVSTDTDITKKLSNAISEGMGSALAFRWIGIKKLLKQQNGEAIKLDLSGTTLWFDNPSRDDATELIVFE